MAVKMMPEIHFFFFLSLGRLINGTQGKLKKKTNPKTLRITYILEGACEYVNLYMCVCVCVFRYRYEQAPKSFGLLIAAMIT